MWTYTEKKMIEFYVGEIKCIQNNTCIFLILLFRWGDLWYTVIFLLHKCILLISFIKENKCEFKLKHFYELVHTQFWLRSKIKIKSHVCFSLWKYGWLSELCDKIETDEFISHCQNASFSSTDKKWLWRGRNTCSYHKNI